MVGRRIPSEVSARFIVYQGRQAVLSVVRDITERKRAEAQITELQEQVASLAIRAERERLGHELHDGIGQVLGFIGMKAAALGDLLRAHDVVAGASGGRRIGPGGANGVCRCAGGHSGLARDGGARRRFGDGAARVRASLPARMEYRRGPRDRGERAHAFFHRPRRSSSCGLSKRR